MTSSSSTFPNINDREPGTPARSTNRTLKQSLTDASQTKRPLWPLHAERPTDRFFARQAKSQATERRTKRASPNGGRTKHESPQHEYEERHNSASRKSHQRTESNKRMKPSGSDNIQLHERKQSTKQNQSTPRQCLVSMPRTKISYLILTEQIHKSINPLCRPFPHRSQ